MNIKQIILSLYLIFVSILYPFLVFCQQDNYFTISKKDDLPTNFIYGSTVDHNGYLWLATPKGAIKYNGYEVKRFDISSGLLTEDIWKLIEDNKGRMWVCAHANQIGYIQNDKFYLIENDGFDIPLNPDRIVKFNNSIAFPQPFSIGNTLFYERSDTLRHFTIKKENPLYGEILGINNKSELVNYSIFKSYKLILDKNGHTDTVFKYTYEVDTTNTTLGPQDIFTYSFDRITHYDDLISIRQGGKTLSVITKDKNKTILLPIVQRNNAKYISSYKRDEELYLRFDQFILKIDSSYKVIAAFYPKAGEKDMLKIPEAYFSPLWDTIYSTNNNGILIAYQQKKKLEKKENLQLDNCILLASNKHESIWQNQKLFDIYFIKEQKIIKKRNPNNLLFNKAAFWDDSTLILLYRSYFAFFYNINTGSLTHIKPNLALPNKFSKSLSVNKQQQEVLFISDPNILMCFSDKEKPSLKIIDSVRYSDAIFCGYYYMHIAYNSNEMLFYNGKKTYIKKNILNSLGIQQIEKVVADGQGNIFIKDINCIWWYNPEKMYFKALPLNVNISETQMTVYEDKLILAGGFGICIYKIILNSPLKLFTIYNPKYKYYKSTYDLSADNHGIIINTNNGVHYCKYPPDSLFQNIKASRINYAVIAKISDSIFQSSRKDTIFLPREEKRISLDIINPFGTGKPQFKYSIGNSGDFIDADNGQIYLDNIESGAYKELRIIVEDNICKSQINSFILYLTPYWWETTTGAAIIALGILSILGCIALTVFFVTKNAIKRKSEQKQLQMDIELKSIYSQINPHFIFNTLSGTQYFIRENKNEAARMHLNKFSRLLRSYIQSSRNKYISIAEEVSNLKNYIELQQIRFEEKFDFEIAIDLNIDAETTFIPSLLLQPLVENAINHGIFHIEGYRGLLKLHFEQGQNKSSILCIIDDNGIGRTKARLIKEDSIIKTKSFGSDLVEDLISIFNKYEKLKIEIEYIDKKLPLTGTTVIIRIENPVYET